MIPKYQDGTRDCSAAGSSHAEKGPVLWRNDNQDRTLIRRVAIDIARIAAAAGLAQILALVAVPFLTRLYNPEAFGHFAIFSALVTDLMPLASLRYEVALPLPSEESIALDLLALCLLLVVGSSFAVALLCPLVGPILAEWTSITGTEIMLLPMAIFAIGLHAVITSWLVRDRAFSWVAHIRFATTVGIVACQICLAQLYPSSTGLILGFIGGYLVGFTLAAYQCYYVLSAAAARICVSGIRYVAAEYRSFAIITAPSGIINALGYQLPSMVLPWLYGLAVTGQYSLAQRVLWQPIVFVGQAVYQVFWGNAARLFTKEPARLWPLFRHLNICLLAVMAPGFVLSWFGAEIFAFVFGSAWEQAGRFAGALVVASFLGLAAQGTTTLEIYRLNHWMSAYEFMRLVLTIGALRAALWIALSPMTCIVAITAVFAMCNATLLNAIAVWRVTLRGERLDHSTATAISSPKVPLKGGCEEMKLQSIKIRRSAIWFGWAKTSLRPMDFFHVCP
jgi:O-antigen/teichoic acid export membrane protein